MRRSDENDYRDFVVARGDALRRTAYLLCRDWYLADDLVSIALGKLYRHWSRAGSAASLDAYVRGILVHAWLDELRRPWRRREEVTADPPEPSAAPEPSHDAVTDRAVLGALLASLPPRQRAVVVLRFYCDLSVAATAEILGVTEGTVKAQAARGLDVLRGSPVFWEG